MCEGKTIVAFANRYRVCSWWILTQTSPSSYLFINKLPSEVQTQQIRKLYEEQKSFDEIAEECYEVYDWLLSPYLLKIPLAMTAWMFLGDIWDPHTP